MEDIPKPSHMVLPLPKREAGFDIPAGLTPAKDIIPSGASGFIQTRSPNVWLCHFLAACPRIPTWSERL
jgi:hypothetical protein